MRVAGTITLHIDFVLQYDNNEDNNNKDNDNEDNYNEDNENKKKDNEDNDNKVSGTPGVPIKMRALAQ